MPNVLSCTAWELICMVPGFLADNASVLLAAARKAALQKKTERHHGLLQPIRRDWNCDADHFDECENRLRKEKLFSSAQALKEFTVEMFKQYIDNPLVIPTVRQLMKKLMKGDKIVI